jgi:hypothetical protein
MSCIEEEVASCIGEEAVSCAILHLTRPEVQVIKISTIINSE